MLNGRVDKPQSFGFLLIPKFAMLAFTAALEPLRGVNLVTGSQLYRWQVISVDGAPVEASNGIEMVANASIDEVDRLDNVIVCGGLGAHKYEDRQVLAWLRRRERQGCRIGAISDGSYILARAGLLNGFSCTIHWTCLPGFQESFPDIDVTNEIFRIDRNRFTASGGTGSMDMMLRLIEQDHGRKLAVRVADQFLHDRIRGDEDHQRMSLRLRLGFNHPRILKAIKFMEDNIEQPLTCADLAEKSGVSTRQLERLFRKYLGCTPRRYYLELRLKRAQRLLTQSSLPVMEVALACGFVSPSHFAKCYREMFRQVPKEARLTQL
jgi:transcriptional regulator GlxA family with amidase domain